jgi:hypothetical protein
VEGHRVRCCRPWTEQETVTVLSEPRPPSDGFLSFRHAMGGAAGMATGTANTDPIADRHRISPLMAKAHGSAA